ncbi:galactose-specific lectin nattectin [Fundulus heteroclitus]|uniref:galactose-specific lectin nattectin n=1 Tax=Fundulus heteroclitus TaxID=8078 RepID=UPI00165BC0D1|nr:galactose-specific lectin nattectin [Fundulus heteroclitus]
MKLLTLSFLLCALLALSLAADAKNETVTQEAKEAVTEGPKNEETVPEPVEDGSEEEESATEGEEETESDADTSEKSHVAKRATSCPSGWTRYGSRCFYYVGASYTWAQAEAYCVARGGNLASARSSSEYNWLRSYIYSRARSYKMTWIGGSDAEQERMWFWSDGSRFSYNSWCSGMPRTTTSYNCLVMNYSACRCWLDYPCSYRYPFVCVRK